MRKDPQRLNVWSEPSPNDQTSEPPPCPLLLSTADGIWFVLQFLRSPYVALVIKVIFLLGEATAQMIQGPTSGPPKLVFCYVS